MGITSGFFDSFNHDRRYNARQMSAIFDGIINDGVFANIGTAFTVSADSGVTINIGVGRAWFNSAWVYNDAPLPRTLEGSEVVLDRIDAVVIEVDHNETVRMGDIKVIKGTPSSSPNRPTMVQTSNKSQHPLAYIYRKAGSTAITQADITNMIGTSECPYITGILQVQNIDNIVAQWNAQWNQWYAEKMAQTNADSSELIAEMQAEFDRWFDNFRDALGEDATVSLAAQVADLMGKFETLALEGCVYDELEDSYFDEILGSDGTPIQGRSTLGGGGGNVDTSGLVAKAELQEAVEELTAEIQTLDEEIQALDEEIQALDEEIQALDSSKMSMDLLWTNASPESEFPAQTISIDTSPYQLFYIECTQKDGSVMRTSAIIRKSQTAMMFGFNVSYFYRPVTPISTGVKFSQGYKYSGGSETKYDLACVPLRVYGIRGVN